MGQLAVEHQVAVEEEHVIVHVLAGEVHGVDVVGLHVDVVGHEGEARLGEVSGFGLQLLGEGTGGDDKVGHALGDQQTQLTVEDRLAVLEDGHGLVVGLGFVAHAVAQAGVKDNRLHSSTLLQSFIYPSGNRGYYSENHTIRQQNGRFGLVNHLMLIYNTHINVREESPCPWAQTSASGGLN